jgi:hypothetical protein
MIQGMMSGSSGVVKNAAVVPVSTVNGASASIISWEPKQIRGPLDGHDERAASTGDEHDKSALAELSRAAVAFDNEA